MDSKSVEIHRKINEKVADGLATNLVEKLLNTIFNNSSNIPVYSFHWNDISQNLVKKITYTSNLLDELKGVANLEYLKIITARVKVDYFSDKLAICLQTKGLISDEYRKSMEHIFLNANLRIEFPESNSCIITLR